MVSYVVHGRSQRARQFYLHTEQHARIVLSSITEGEIRFGLDKRPEATRLRSTFETFFATIEILPWDSAVARVYGKLRAALNATGRTLSLMDLLIAAHAIAAGATLVSHDRALLQLTPHLPVVDWASDL